MLRELLFLAVAATAFAEDHDHQNCSDYPEESEEAEERPVFTATPQDLVVEVNGNITLPCDFEDKGNKVLTLLKFTPIGEQILFVGDGQYFINDRFKKVNNSYVITAVQPCDAGKYECRITGKSIVSIVHSLDVQFPATANATSQAVENEFGWSRESEFINCYMTEEDEVGQSASGGTADYVSGFLMVPLLMLAVIS